MIHGPRLLSDVRISDTPVSVSDASFRAAIERTLSRFNGKTSIGEIVQTEPTLSQQDIANLIQSLDRAGLIDDEAEVVFQSGSEVILDLEELVEKICATTIYQNPFWQTCLTACQPGDLPEKLAGGVGPAGTSI